MKGYLAEGGPAVCVGRETFRLATRGGRKEPDPKGEEPPTNLPNKRGWTTGLPIPHFVLGVRIA